MEFTQTPCAACGNISTEDEEMVCCESCNRWSHSRCVGLTAAAKKEKKWYCNEAACQVAAKEYQKKKKKSGRGRKDTDESDRSSVKSDCPLTSSELLLKEMEENQARLEREFEAECKLREKEMIFKIALEEKKLRFEKKMREKEEGYRKLMLEEQLKEKKEHLERMKNLEESFRGQMSNLDDELSKLKERTAKKEKHKKPRVKSLKEVPTENDANTFSEESGSQTKTESESECDEDPIDDDEVSETSSDGNKRHKTQKDKSRKRHGLGQQRAGPTKAQQLARGGLNKKLPTFTGKPEEWPLFYGAYQATNEACGYSDVENLVRLQECLKGQALESVRGLLIMPKTVPRVIAKLRQLYGRPEQLLRSYLEKVSKLESPKADKLASFIPFANEVEQLCEHLEAADLKRHLINPTLIADLVDKLPDGDKRAWVRFKRDKGEVTLRTFTDFLNDIVDEACEANVEYKPSYKQVTSNLTGRGRVMGRGTLYNHSEEDVSTLTSSHRLPKPCKVCHRTDHRLRFCQEFRNLSFPDRMRVVSRWRLCHVCLNDHGGTQCKFKIRCNIGLCREQHNPLLHPLEDIVGTSAHIRTNSPVMFRMIPVKLHCGEETVTVLAFLDEGASVTLMERKLADRLGITGIPEKLTIQWTADITRIERESQRMNVWASAVGTGDKVLLKTVRTVEKLMLPSQVVDASELMRQYKHIRGLPIASYDGWPEVLIGLNNIHSFAPIDTKIGAIDEPIAVRCKLGWTVYGPTQARIPGSGNYLGLHRVVSNADLQDLQKCSEVEEKVKCAGDQDGLEAKKKEKLCEGLEADKRKLTVECNALRDEIKKIRTENNFLKSKQSELKTNLVQDEQGIQEPYKSLHKEYFRRSEWYDELRDVKVDGSVFVVDGKNKKSWIRGKVEEVFAGKDGRVRQANVRTAEGILKRGVANLAVMEIEDGKSGTVDEVSRRYGLGC